MGERTTLIFGALHVDITSADPTENFLEFVERRTLTLYSLKQKENKLTQDSEIFFLWTEP